MTGSRHKSRGSSLATVLPLVALGQWRRAWATAQVRGRKEHAVMATVMIPTGAELPTQTD
jgi:hypothetical protein